MNSKPKLLIYAASWNGKKNLLFSSFLADHFDIVVMTYLIDDEGISDLIKPAKAVYAKFLFKNKVGLSFSLKFKEYIKEYKPDYVLTIETHSIASFQSIKLSKQFNFESIIFSWQNAETIPRYFFQRLIQKYILFNSNFLLAGSIDAKDYLIMKGAESKKIFINPETGYSERIFTQTGINFRKEWGFEFGDIIILYAGRIVIEKGIKTILKAAKRMESVNSLVKFVFIGKGNQKKLIKFSGIKNVYYKGIYDFTEMGKVIRTCDIFIYPSISTKYWIEQFGYSVIEAHACGKPVIVTNSGNLPRFIIENINGSVIEEGDEVSLTEKISLWCNKLKINKSIGKVSTAKFSFRNIALNYKKILLDKDCSFLNNWF